MLAHDLRTPIAGIKLMSGLLEGASENKIKECSTNIIDCCDNTLTMMDDLLSHIQMSREGVRLNLRPLIIEDEIREVCNEFSPQIVQKKITINLPVTQTSLALDAIKFKQILSNLISNAIKFSFTKGDVNVLVEENDTHVDMVVIDNGIGITEELIPEVFDIFTNARREGTEGEKSTGIGLSITKRLVELHNASIEVISKLNQGTEFRVSFPK